MDGVLVDSRTSVARSGVQILPAQLRLYPCNVKISTAHRYASHYFYASCINATLFRKITSRQVHRYDSGRSRCQRIRLKTCAIAGGNMNYSITCISTQYSRWRWRHLRRSGRWSNVLSTLNMRHYFCRRDFCRRAGAWQTASGDFLYRRIDDRSEVRILHGD